jgi:hypothetical protein
VCSRFYHVLKVQSHCCVCPWSNVHIWGRTYNFWSKDHFKGVIIFYMFAFALVVPTEKKDSHMTIPHNHSCGLIQRLTWSYTFPWYKQVHLVSHQTVELKSILPQSIVLYSFPTHLYPFCLLTVSLTWHSTDQSSHPMSVTCGI